MLESVKLSSSTAVSQFICYSGIHFLVDHVPGTHIFTKFSSVFQISIIFKLASYSFINEPFLQTISVIQSIEKPNIQTEVV